MMILVSKDHHGRSKVYTLSNHNKIMIKIHFKTNQKKFKKKMMK